MKKFIPSFRLQIGLIFLVLLILSVIFTRGFFLGSFREYAAQLASRNIEGGLHELHARHRPALPSAEQTAFKNDIEQLLVKARQTELLTDLYEREITTYSVYIAIFVLLLVLLLFLFFLYQITRPLRRLQEATRALSGGNVHVRVAESRLSPINDVIVSFNQMVSDLERSRRRAIEAEKKLIWREIARVMAHEIKNPLTPIKLSVERLEFKYQQDPESVFKVVPDSVSVIKEEIENLQSLVDRFRDFAMLPEAKPEVYSLAEQLQEIAKPYQEMRNIEMQLAADMPVFYGDKVQLKQVFVNLLQNAIQATAEDGRIAIRASFTLSEFRIVLEDDGKGIATDRQELIFEPYYTSRRKGTGLGLPVVKRIVENHGGSIEVESEMDKGSRFTIRIPYANIHS